MVVSEYWKGKRVCVTGGAGFVGVQLVGELIKAGAQVAVLDNWTRGQNRLWDANYITGDANNESTVTYAYQPRWAGESAEDIYKAKVDVVFNLVATVAGVLHNMNHHHRMFLDNVNLQTVPLMVAERMEIPVFVQVSSVCIYDPRWNHPAIESEMGPNPHKANEGYAWAKKMGEQAVGWSNIERAVIVRPSNIFGPHDYFDDKAHVIPAVIKRVIEEPVVHMYGPRDVMREFIYSNDVALGMMAAAEFGEDKQAYNIGANGYADNITTMDDLVTSIMSIVGTVKEVYWHEDVGGGDPLRWSDCAKANGKLNWSHKVGLFEGLERTIEWYNDSRK
jgi:GDP-L-fucose synthase